MANHALTCFLGSNLMVSVCTRNGSNGGSCGFTGRKAENGTLTCTKQTIFSIFSSAQPDALTEGMYLQMPLTLQNPTFVFIRAKYFLVCEVSASGPVSRIITYDLPFPPTERSNPSYLQVEWCSIQMSRSCNSRQIGWNWNEIQQLAIPVQGGTQRKRKPFRHFNVATPCENKPWK